MNRKKEGIAHKGIWRIRQGTRETYGRGGGQAVLCAGRLIDFAVPYIESLEGSLAWASFCVI